MDINGNKICLTPGDLYVPVCFEATKTYDWGPKEPVASDKYVDSTRQNFMWYPKQLELAGQVAPNNGGLPGIIIISP